MSGSPQDFRAKVDAWVREKASRMVAVRNEAVQRTIEVMQTPVGAGGNLPVDTGFLRSSLVYGVGQVKAATRENPRPDAPKGSLDDFDVGGVNLVLADAPLGTPIEAVYTAVYSRRLHYGFIGEDALGRTYNQPGRMWVSLAAQQWPRIVEEVVAEAKQRVASKAT